MIDIYHGRQYEKINKSTECFVNWLENMGYLVKEVEQNICDMAWGVLILFT